MENNDAQLQLKKRARRRLVGAVAFAGFAAVVLPMIMDHEPKQEAQDVEIRIPGQDEKPFAPKFATAPAPKPSAKPAEAAEKPGEKAPEKASEKPAPANSDKAGAVKTEKPADKPVEKAPVKAEKAPEKPAERAPEKTADKPADKGVKGNEGESQRAAAILAGKPPEAATSSYVILIGAFSNPANVKNLQVKLGEMGIKVYTEPLDSPQGKKIRVRAGPFPSREAGEKALEKMKRIGVSGVLSAT